MSDDDVLIKVEGVSKKFCRSLKRSMVYGMQDITREALRLPVNSGELRPDEFWAVEDVSFEVRRGECLGIIGPNGAGKSTLLKMLNGIMPPDRGKITVRGRVGALIELGAGFHPMLTGRENIYINGAILGLSRKEIDKKFDEIVAFAELEKFIDSPVKNYSSGMYVRLGFSVAAFCNTQLILIDEVLAVGDTSFRLKCFNYFLYLLEKGTSILLVSHNLSEINRVCSRGIFLHNSRVICYNSIEKSILSYQKKIMDTNASIKHYNYNRKKEFLFKFKKISTYKTTGVESHNFFSYENILLIINYESLLSVENCTIIIKVTSFELGPLASFSNQASNTPIPIIKGEGKVCVTLESLPLLAGNYGIEVHIYDQERKIFWNQAIPGCNFEIDEPIPNVWNEYHTLRIKHKWIFN